MCCFREVKVVRELHKGKMHLSLSIQVVPRGCRTAMQVSIASASPGVKHPRSVPGSYVSIPPCRNVLVGKRAAAGFTHVRVQITSANIPSQAPFSLKYLTRSNGSPMLKIPTIMPRPKPIRSHNRLVVLPGDHCYTTEMEAEI